jgi:hypothetical protein
MIFSLSRVHTDGKLCLSDFLGKLCLSDFPPAGAAVPRAGPKVS